MNIDIKILTTINIILMLYICTCKNKNVEKMSDVSISDIKDAINELYKADFESIRNLSEIAKKLLYSDLETNDPLNVSSDLNVSRNTTLQTVNVNKLEFSTTSSGITKVSGDYGTIQTYGKGAGNWSGYSINGEWVFMSSNKDTVGIYNDTDDKWLLEGKRNGGKQTVKIDGQVGIEASIQSNHNYSLRTGNGIRVKNSLEIQFSEDYSWTLENYVDQNLGFFQNDTIKGYIEDDGGVNNSQMNFTGQHRSFIQDIPFSNTKKYQGMIVCANKNINISMSGSIKKGNQAITQNETLPYCSLACKNYDKSCFGVISDSEDPDHRVDKFGSFCTPYEKENGDTRIYINSVGEGAIWVTNMNGPLESGDYITTSNLPGYGMKQHDDLLHNYTVAKITMDCDFNPKLQPVPTIMKDSSGNNILDKYNVIQWTDLVDDSGNIVYEHEYNIRYLNKNGKIINKKEYNMIGGFIAAYVGCTYHCG